MDDTVTLRINLTEFESDFVDALAFAEGKTRSEILHELVMGGARAVLSGEMHLDNDGTVNATQH